MSNTSTKPYLLRALYEWCTDNSYTPHIVVYVDQRTRVPREFVKDDEIVLNISFEATGQLQMGNDWLDFSARFSERPCKVEIPIDNILAIYAAENGQGMAFPVDKESLQKKASDQAEGRSAEESYAPNDATVEAPDPAEPKAGGDDKQGSAKSNHKGGRGHLKVIK